MQGLIYQHRNYGAELLLDDLLSICTAANSTVTVHDIAVDITASCEVLAAWDRRNAVTSRGGHVWREFWRTGRSIDGVYAVPFDFRVLKNAWRRCTVDACDGPRLRVEERVGRLERWIDGGPNSPGPVRR